LTPDPSPVPMVSVVMPVYNCARFLAAAIESILTQTFADFEFLIVDDGSDDATPNIVADYARRDPRIRAFRNSHNEGIVVALNRGLDESRGHYIARMDGDDISLPDRLEKQVAWIDKKPDIDVLGAALTYIDAHSREIGLVRHCTLEKSILSQCPLLHPTVLIRRESLERHKLRYRQRYNCAEDYYLWLEMSRHGRFAALEEIVLRYRMSEGATRVRRLKKVLRATLRAKKDAVFRLGIRPRPGDILRYLQECILLLLPSRLILQLYMRRTFGQSPSLD